jgi:hypothetical protein
LPLYLFSNVNNGVPKFSCHEFLIEQIKDNMNAFRAGLIVMLVIEFSFLGGFLIVVSCKCKKACDKRIAEK